MRSKELRRHLKAALRIADAMSAAQSGLDGRATLDARDEANRAIQHSRAIILALLADQPVPVSLFKPWCSYSVLWRMQRQGRVQLYRVNRKACIVPSDFFALWTTMRDR